MKKKITDLISIDSSLSTPIYKQIVNCICRSIDNGVLLQNDALPSVNSIIDEFSLARGSVFNAYNDLKSTGIISSIPGKGYYVSSTQTHKTKKIFLLFSTFTPYKETLYNALISSLSDNCKIDIYFHHHSIKIFETLIREQADYYNTFVIMPELHSRTPSILSSLDQRHLLLLDVGYTRFERVFPGVYQHFQKDIYSILMRFRHLVEKYKKLHLVLPEGHLSPDILSGFNQFACMQVIPTRVLDKIDPDRLQKGDAFIVIEDNDLVDVIRSTRSKKWLLGTDVGVISYNETELKSVIANGITTITTDFSAMGKSMAGMINSGERKVIENPFVLIERDSF